MRKIAGVLAPKGSVRREITKGILKAWLRPGDYNQWARERMDKIQLHSDNQFENYPLISVVIPAFNTPQKYLDPCVWSIINQTYSNWELIIVNASKDARSSKLIQSYIQSDTRIQVINKKNEGISANTNAGIELAKGQYIAFVDHDDVLDIDALRSIVEAINTNPDVGVIYSDEDKLSEDGSKYMNPHFKPGWSPHLLTHVNYITHFVVASKALVDKVGRLDPAKDGAQDYDLLLKLTDLDVPIRHIPRVLYHWRVADMSTAADVSNKPYVLKAGEAALSDHFRRRKIKAIAKARPNMPGFYSTIHRGPRPTLIIMPFANQLLVERYLSILDSRGLLAGYRIIKPEYKKADFLKDAVSEAEENVIIINDFIIPENKSWASDLSGLLSDKRVFAVAPAVLTGWRSVLDMGLVNHNTERRLLFAGEEFGVNTPFGNTSWPRNVDYLTGSVIAARKKDLQLYLDKKPEGNRELTGFSEAKGDKFNVVWSDVVVTHVRVPLAGNASRFYNPNINAQEDSQKFYINEQQILDALVAMEGVA